MQSDLISKQALIKFIDKKVVPELLLHDNASGAGVMGGFSKVLEEMDVFPTIDAVPVVRCKDCVHYKPKDAMTPGDNRMRCDHPCLDYDIECYDLWLDVEPNDYCKYGEKKMDGGAQE